MGEETKEQKQALEAADMPKCNQDTVHGTHAAYEILVSLGKGAFGEVFRVRRLHDKKELAMKCESVHVKKQILRHEARVLQGTSIIKSPHLLQFEDRGKVTGRFAFIVIRLVGRNLWDLRAECPDKKFSIGTSMHVAEQTLAGIRDLHRAGFLHRDIKAPNFAVGREEEGTQHHVYILDFGLCRRFKTQSKEIRMPREKAGFRGTTRYASISSLEGKEQCRKDDLESWWYMLVEWTIGSLPWKGCKGNERAEVKAYKQQLRMDANMNKVLKNMPLLHMKAILLYLDSLEYNMIPDYDFIHRQLVGAMQANKVPELEPPDWDLTTDYKGPKYVYGIDTNKPLVDRSARQQKTKSKRSQKEKASVR